MSATLTDGGPVAGTSADAPDDTNAAAAGAVALTPHVPLTKAVLLFNPASGSVGPNVEAEARAIFDAYGLAAELQALSGDFDATLDAAFAAEPDVIFVLAGDGTARSVASRAGPDGPLVAPLPGGTMNMLPKALYGTTDWQAALRSALEAGEARFVAGGRVGAEPPFYCAAILGSPALWAPAREAVRSGRLGLAWAHARRALKRAFSGRIRFSLDGSRPRRAEALVLISPMISRAMDEPVGLEAAAMDPGHAADAFRLAAHALFDDWRHDPAVTARPAKRAVVSARSRIPAVIDGEPVMLDREEAISFVPRAFRALAPRLPQTPPPAAEGPL